jgi:hypothetical protein
LDAHATSETLTNNKLVKNCCSKKEIKRSERGRRARLVVRGTLTTSAIATGGTPEKKNPHATLDLLVRHPS